MQLERKVMRRLLLLAIPLVATLLGCTRYAGPLAVRRMDRADALGPDGRPYTLEEQAIRARERYNIPSDDFRVGPPIGLDGVSPTGR
jgi:hypothetical protein